MSALNRKGRSWRILLVDDHAVLRQGMRRLIEAEADMEIVGEADDGSEVEEKVKSLRPDIVIMDLSMPGLDGRETVRRLKASGSSCKVLVLTVQEDPGYLRDLLGAGALGYMLKRAAAEELIPAVRAIAGGSVYVDSRLAPKLMCSLSQSKGADQPLLKALTGREEDVLRAIAEGHSTKEIASLLKISAKTVETYKARSMEKLGLRSRVDIVHIARERGWLGHLHAS